LSFELKGNEPTRNPQPATRNPSTGTVLGFDFGLKRIGVAVGEIELGTTHPLATIAEEVNDKRFAAIAALIEAWKPVLLVVGVPSHQDGGEHALADTCRRFARRLEGRFELPVVLVDEQYTSASASSALAEAGVTGRKQKTVLDQVAAQEILQTYLRQFLADRQKI
jgi:putative Holliday junction resolvase